MRRLLVLTLLAALVTVGAVLAGGGQASNPASQTITVPLSGSQSVSWTGTIPAPSSHPDSSCPSSATVPGGDPTADYHTITVDVPAGTYDSKDATFVFQISWNPSTGDENTNDEILSVYNGDGEEVGSSDGSSTSETVIAKNLPSDDYEVVACGFVNGLPQDYSGSLTITTTPRSTQTNPPSVGTPAQFSAAIPADNQRDEAEPLMEIDKSGLIYTCGPTGFSNAADYAQVSTDSGDQFHMLGTPPRGQQSGGGGGDCGLATSYAQNSQGKYQYAYAGLGALSGFATATSPNNGHSLGFGGFDVNSTCTVNGGVLGSDGAGCLTDRQWLTFVDDSFCAGDPTPPTTPGQCVIMSYNEQEPRNVVVVRSDDGGVVYNPIGYVAGWNPRFPGPMRYDEKRKLAYFAWDATAPDGNDQINLSISRDGGTTWTDCWTGAEATPQATSFVVADNDNKGNIYIAYTDEEQWNTYMVSLPASKVLQCNEPVSASSTKQPTKNPGFSQRTQVNRDDVNTTVFPWLVAEGAAGHVAVAFYGTTQDGDPNQGDFKAAWDVYVNESQNALAGGSAVDFSQAKVTTHPFHYDSICQLGLGCDLAVPAGDRSLADFFAIDVNRSTGRLHVVFDRGEKKPDEAAGHVATPMVANQIGGPSLKGTTISLGPPVVRQNSLDPTGDALSSYSDSTPVTPPPSPATTNEPAADFRRVTVEPELDIANGFRPVPNGGFSVEMAVADLSQTAMQKALTDTGSSSLMYVFRFVNGYQAAAAVASWNPLPAPSGTWTFGYNDYTTGTTPCKYPPSGGTSGEEKCVVYPGTNPIQGDVRKSPNGPSWLITMSVPKSFLRALGPNDQYGRPTEVPATCADHSRFYDAAAWSLGNSFPDPSNESFLYPLDNTPAMDFLLVCAKNTKPQPPGDPTATLTKTGPLTAGAGSTFTYTLAYQNLGPNAAANAKVVDVLPAGETFVSASNGATYSAGSRTVTWSLGVVPPKGKQSLTLTVGVPAGTKAGTQLYNQAEFDADQTISPPIAVWATTVTG